MEGLRRAARHVLIFPIKLYQRYLSPLFPRRCKYHPTCSAYAIKAIGVHGVFKGSLLALWRLLRCNPFSYGGYDPVPPKGRWKNDDIADEDDEC